MQRIVWFKGQRFLKSLLGLIKLLCMLQQIARPGMGISVVGVRVRSGVVAPLGGFVSAYSEGKVPEGRRNLIARHSSNSHLRRGVGVLQRSCSESDTAHVLAQCFTQVGHCRAERLLERWLCNNAGFNRVQI